MTSLLNSLLLESTILLTALSTLLSSICFDLPLLLPLDHLIELLRSPQQWKVLLAKFEQWMIELIQEKRDKLQSLKEGEESPVTDILDVLVRAHDGESGSLTDKEVIHNMNTFFIAGHETTASALTISLHLLAEHPEIQRRCFEDIINVSGDEDATSDQLKEMKFLEACVKEALRMYSPAPNVARTVKEDTTIGGYFFPKGTMVLAMIHTIHRNPKHWKDPDAFNPDRFIEDKERDSFLLLPFSKGSRMCIGVNFAMLELKALLSLMLRKYEFYKEESDPRFKPFLGAVLSPNPACPIRFRPRV